MKQPTPVLGEVYPVPFATVSGTVIVNCVMLDTRTVYGRVEWKVAPRDGDRWCWMQEKSIISGAGGLVHSGSQKRNAKLKAAKN